MTRRIDSTYDKNHNWLRLLHFVVVIIPIIIIIIIPINDVKYSL